MFQFKLVDGDLSPGPGGYAVVSGAERIQQDLGALVREALGMDRFHPGWGTIMDDFTGVIQDQESLLMIESELLRLIQNYIVMQTQQIEADDALGLKNRFDPSEIISSVGDIQIQPQEDKIVVRVSVQTVGGGETTVLRSVGGGDL